MTEPAAGSLDVTPALDRLTALADSDRVAVLAWAILRARRGVGFSLAECAGDLGVPESAVRSAVSRLVTAELLRRDGDLLAYDASGVADAAAELKRERADVISLLAPHPRLAGLFSHGRLVRLPDTADMERELANALAPLFEPERDYPEMDVNRILQRISPDFASLRRFLVDAGHLTRDHSIYRRSAPPGGAG